LTLLHDVSAPAGSGDLDIGRLLDAAVKFANSPERRIVAEAREMVAVVKRQVPLALLDNYARFVLKVFGERARSPTSRGCRQSCKRQAMPTEPRPQGVP